MNVKDANDSDARKLDCTIDVQPASPHDAHHSEELPFPPRYWWLKRILAAMCVLLLMLLGLRWWWGWDAERKLQARIAEYRALGQPVTLEDFKLPPIPDEDNAAYFLKQAAARITVPPGLKIDFHDISHDPDTLNLNAADITTLLVANKATFDRIDRAMTCNLLDWKVNCTTTNPFPNQPELSQLPELGKLLALATRFAHLQGDDDLALQHLQRQLYIGRVIVGREASLERHLVSMVITSFAYSDIEDIAPNLRFNPSERSTSLNRHDRSSELIQELLDESALRENWRQACYGERLLCVNSFQNATSSVGPFFSRSGLTNLRHHIRMPMYKLDEILMLEFYTRALCAGLCDDFQEGSRYMRDDAFPTGGFERLSHIISYNMLPSCQLALKLHFRMIAMRRSAAIALALRLYAIERGQRPENLEALVPDYLPYVPRDPFAADDRPMSYLPEATHPILYSVGPDGIDDHGQYELTEEGGVDEHKLDLVFFLNGQRPTPPAPVSTTQPNGLQTVVDESEEISDRGDAEQDDGQHQRP